MGRFQYAAVPQAPSQAEKQDGLSTQPRQRTKAREISGLWSGLRLTTIAVLAASITLNAVLLCRVYVRPWELMSNLPTRYAGLTRNVRTEIIDHTDHESTNRTLQDVAWSERDLQLGPGMVALEDQYASSLGLPHSQRYPWDHDKGVYVLMSTHELHCLHALREYINDNEDQKPKEEQFWHYGHMMHCLNIIRMSIICNADDTPMYTGRVIDGKVQKAGIGSTRMCRSWDALTAWSEANTACYKPVHRGEEDFPEKERYKFCPDGSKPWLKGHKD
ncbi:hypothetical protein K461DRAFT_322042 [Myriangium duriaei CBS 260.36]|uniref:Uncharacterized protein n=1 Tax=Myriangium duriaei CBS 260.36 TaxID=1168546 RepID=A0A9P4IZQ0_9PEZI|nr:hypothetical protein K461DRAFT_322042 [Myriangium duriaei CBS 260.36]